MRPAPTVLFEVEVKKPQIVFYRGIKSFDGRYRLLRRARFSKGYKTYRRVDDLSSFIKMLHRLGLNPNENFSNKP